MSTLQELAKELLPWVQALTDGKAVEYQSIHNGKFIPVSTIRELFQYGEDGMRYCKLDKTLRIKPEPKYRPFTEEEMKKQIGRTIRRKVNGCLHCIHTVQNTGSVQMSGDLGGTWERALLFHEWDFYDPATGVTSPFGVLESE